MKRKIGLIGFVLVSLLVIVTLSIYPYAIPKEEVEARYGTDFSRYVTTEDGAVIHYQDIGDKSGQTLVLVHGSNMSVYAWEAWIDLLKDKLRIVAIDMPAHGLTGRVPNDDYSISNMVNAVQAVVEELELDKFFLGGNSMGGNVTWRFALEHQQGLKGIILMDASGHPRENNAFTIFDVAKLPIIRDIPKQLAPRFLIAAGLRDAVFDKSLITDEIIERNFIFSRREGTQEANALRFKAQNVGDWYKRMGEISVPALIMWGMHDHFVPVADAKRFHDELPNSELILYPDLAHMPMIEDPSTTAADAMKFIKAHQ